MASLTSDSIYEPPTINVTNGKPAVKNELTPRREAINSVAKPGGCVRCRVKNGAWNGELGVGTWGVVGVPWE